MAFAVVGAMALCVLVTWDRDRDERTYQMACMEACRAQLQERLDKAGALPPGVYQQPRGFPPRLPERFIGPAGRVLIGRLPEPVLVAHSTLVRQYLRYHGRVVILLEDGQLRVEWWNSGRLSHEWRAQEHLIEELTRQAEAEPPKLP